DAPDRLAGERLGHRRDARSGRGPWDEVSRAHVADTDDELALAPGVLDPRDAEGLAVRMVANRDNPGDDDPIETTPRPFDRLDQHPARDQQLRESLRIQVGRRELPEPGDRNPHQAAPNCSRNRTSPSIS